jgi:hypothetical protein
MGKPAADGMFRIVAALPRPRRWIVVLSCLAALLLTAPLDASATTGRGVTRAFRVTLTDRGVTWKPALRTLDPLVGGSLRLTVVNGSSRAHWFRVGTVRSKPIAPRGTARLSFTFKRLGPVAWVTGLGAVGTAPFHGAIRVRLPGVFS